MSSPNVPVIVYQMGKVGSMSIFESLQRTGLALLYHVHVLNPRHCPWVTEREPSDPNEHEQKTTGRIVHQQIIVPKKRAKFITLVREPIARNISTFFENFEERTGRPFARSSFSLEELARIFAAHKGHRFPLMYFDREVKEVLGIDVYAHAFPRAQGHVSISQGVYELLVLKCELDDAIKEAAVADFLGLASFRIKRTNLSARKNYADTYRRFTESVRLPEAYLQAMLSAPYTRHFYSTEEIEQLHAYWSDPRRSVPVPTDVAVPLSVP